MKKNRIGIIALIASLLLLIPLMAMQFTDEVSWKLSDFLMAAVLLFGTGFAIDFVIRKVKKRTYRIVLSIAILVILVLIWAEFAVGIFD